MKIDEQNTMPPAKREEFRKFLLGLHGENVAAEIEALSQKIAYPRFLFRYRATDVKSLDCLVNNKLYFSSAKYYDDPFDTYLYIDYERVLAGLRSFISDTEQTELMVPRMADMFGLPVEWLKEIFSTNNLDFKIKFMEQNAHILCDIVQKESYSICFSDHAANEVLWLKYANNHHGFALMYDMYDPDAWLCSQCEKCVECGMRSGKTPVYPVCYTDEAYDATRFAQAFATIRNLELTGASQEYLKQARETLGEQCWEREKIALIKHKCHEYDREWRMVSHHSGDGQFVKWKPCAVIMGLRTTGAERNMIATAARAAGIDKIFLSRITNENKLNPFGSWDGGTIDANT